MADIRRARPSAPYRWPPNGEVPVIALEEQARVLPYPALSVLLDFECPNSALGSRILTKVVGRQQTH
jgi:hypothetical protein